MNAQDVAEARKALTELADKLARQSGTYMVCDVVRAVRYARASAQAQTVAQTMYSLEATMESIDRDA